jgi:hypothetical protein
MATALETLITSCGATFERREGGTFPGPRCIRLYVTAAQGLCVGIHLDGNSSQPDVFVLSWHMASGATAELNDATFGGSVNKFHRRKATYVACGFEDLRRQLEVGLRLAADGRAFLPKPELIAA